TSADFVERRENRDRIEEYSVDCNGSSLTESNRNFFRFIRRKLWRRGQHEEISRRTLARIFEHSAFVRDVPDVAVTRIDLLTRRSYGNVVLRGVVERIFAALDIPHTPRGNHRKIRGEGSIRELETNLVVAFAGASMRERVGTDPT